MTKDSILKLTGAADLVSKDGLVILIYPYRPFMQNNEDILELDSYYVACNQAYKAAKKANIGVLTNDIDIKAFLVSCGMKKGRSSLVFHPEFGSYFLAQAIKTDFRINDNSIYTPELLCTTCNACSNACPGSAIKNNTFIRNKCIRDMIDFSITDETAPYLGSQFLGCQICRKVCPHNSSIQFEAMPNELATHLELKTILKFENETKNVLQTYVGKNMARASMLLPPAMMIAFKKQRYDLADLIKSLTAHPSDKVSASAKFVINAFEKSY